MCFFPSRAGILSFRGQTHLSSVKTAQGRINGRFTLAFRTGKFRLAGPANRQISVEKCRGRCEP